MPTTAPLLAAESAIGPTLAIIIGVGMVAQWVAWRLQIPSIIMLLSAGLLVGPVLDVVDPDEFLGGTLFPVVSLSVAIILFEGGLDLPPRELRNTGTVVRRLITLGAAITFAVGLIGARWLFDMSTGAAAVLAAVLVVTGPTVVGPLLRFVRPSGVSGPMLRAEGILIDPLGATAGLLAFEVALTDEVDEAFTRVVVVVLLTIVAGAGIGLIGAVGLDQALKRFLIPDVLTTPVAITVVIVAFVASNEVQEEAGLLAVTVLGIYLARRDTAAVRQLLEFSETLRTLLISALFILLAARIEADALRDVFLPSLVFLAVLVFVGRPLSVLFSTLRTSTTWRERVFLASMAPRGIVAAAISAIFALRLEEEGVEGAEQIVPIVFLVIIGTILVYGFGAGPIARRLGLAEARASGVLIVGAHAAARGFGKTLQDLEVKTVLVDTDPYNITRSVAMGLKARRLSALNEEAAHALDLRGIGRMVAMTSNDEANALATARFARVFGRRETFQLATAQGNRSAELPESVVGRIIGIKGLTYDTIDERLRQGWRVRASPAGPVSEAAYDDDRLIPFARVYEGQVAFVCRNDPVPANGHVIGLAAPSLQRELDRMAEADAADDDRDGDRDDRVRDDGDPASSAHDGRDGATTGDGSPDPDPAGDASSRAT